MVQPAGNRYTHLEWKHLTVRTDICNSNEWRNTAHAWIRYTRWVPEILLGTRLYEESMECLARNALQCNEWIAHRSIRHEDLNRMILDCDCVCVCMVHGDCNYAHVWYGAADRSRKNDSKKRLGMRYSIARQQLKLDRTCLAYNNL